MTAPTLILVPGLLGRSPRSRSLFAITGAGMLAYSLMTRYELSAYKALPMRTHVALDAVSGALLAAAPVFLQDSPAVTAACIGVGLYEIAAALTTEPEAPVAEQASWFCQHNVA